MGAFDVPQLIAYFTILEHTSKQGLKDPTIREAIEQAAFRLFDYLDNLPLRKGTTPLALLPDYEETILELQSHSDNDSYWTEREYHMAETGFQSYTNVPVLNVAGWYDAWCRQQLEIFSKLVKLNKKAQRIVVGPWTHGGAGATYAGEVDFGLDSEMYGLLRAMGRDISRVPTPPESSLPQQRVRGDWGNPLYFLWFDQWLRGGAHHLLDESPVWIFVMGGGDGRKSAEGKLKHGGRWREENAWPLARARQTPYYFHADGKLTQDKPSPSTPSSYTFDPANPVPSIGGTIWTWRPSAPARYGESFRQTPPAGAMDQRCRLDTYPCRNELPLASRPDLLVFQTDPLQQDVEVTGPIVGKLWVSSSARDTDFAAKLIDVYPPNSDFSAGFGMNLCDGIQRARYRNSLQRAELMEPGKVYPLEVVLYPTSNLFKAGHRIRVDVTSSNFPRFDVNPNTGGPLGKDRNKIVAVNSLYHAPEHPSHIVLPIVSTP